jgi:hypothetical protein
MEEVYAHFGFSLDNPAIGGNFSPFLIASLRGYLHIRRL